MRLSILDHGHRPLQKVQLSLIRLLVGRVPGPLLVMAYRRELFGKPWAQVVHEAMREMKEWTVFEVELFATFISNLNACEY